MDDNNKKSTIPDEMLMDQPDLLSQMLQKQEEEKMLIKKFLEIQTEWNKAILHALQEQYKQLKTISNILIFFCVLVILSMIGSCLSMV